MSEEWEALQGDVAMLGEIMERFMVATLNGERDEAGDALEELQDLLASWKELAEVSS